MDFYCYRFPDQTEFRILCAQADLLTEDNELITSSHTHAIDEIGIIYEGGVYGPDGEVITPPTELPGWHVNTVDLAPEAWDQYLVVVNSPARIFAGGPTQAPDTATLQEMTS